MTKSVIFLWAALVVFPTVGVANDDWVCRELASKREDRAILACGIGQAPTEAGAREQALRNAKTEFNGICESSADCKDHETVLVPLRNECKENGSQGFRCWRAIRFEILDRKVVKNEPPPAPVASDMGLTGNRQPASSDPSATSGEPTAVTARLVDNTKQKHFILGAQIGASSATIQGGQGFFTIPMFMEWKWGRLGLRLGVELDSNNEAADTASAGTSFGGHLSGWQALIAMPIWVIDLPGHGLVLLPQARLVKQSYQPKDGGTGSSSSSFGIFDDQTYWQTGAGASLEYRLSLGSVVRLAFGGSAISYGDDNGSQGRVSIGGTFGLLLLL